MIESMKILTANVIDEKLDFPSLIEALRIGFTEQFTIPQRMHLDYANPVDQNENTLLLMPAVACGSLAGVKIVNVASANPSRQLSSIQGIYYLFDSVTGTPKAILDAPTLTNWRTAAASALAATYLAPKDASCLLIIGTGALAPFVVEAHAAIRPIRKLLILGRNQEKARQLASRFSERFEEVELVSSLESDMPKADIISAVTFSPVPVVHGRWLRPGQHIDLIGSFKPDMREADDQVITRSSIFVDNLESAPIESGDLAIPLAEQVIKAEDIRGDLFQLCKGEIPGRELNEEITLFKSVGHAIEDLIAARLLSELSNL